MTITGYQSWTRRVSARRHLAGLLSVAALAGCGDEPKHGRWTQSEDACPGPGVDTVAFGSDFIEFHVAERGVTERIDAVVDDDADQLIVRFYNEVVEPFGTFAWSFRKLDGRRMERIRVEVGGGHQFEPVEGDPVMFYACP